MIAVPTASTPTTQASSATSSSISDLRDIAEQQRRELIARAQRGDTTARNEVVMLNMGLVRRVVQRYRRLATSMNHDDLTQEGVLGLIKAVARFDLDKGYRFSTYAMWWIKQAVLKALRERDRDVAVPMWIYEARKTEVARAATLQAAHDARRPFVRLDAAHDPSAVHEANGALVEQFASASTSTEDRYAAEEARAVVADRLALLPDREQTILRLAYGDDDLQLSEIGRRLRRRDGRTGLTRERVRQLKDRALKQLAASIDEGEVEALY